MTTGTLSMGWRILGITGLLVRKFGRLGWLLVESALTGRSFARRRDAWLVEVITDLGPAFIKMAQLLSTRPDLVPPRICRALGSLYDTVRPIPATELVRLLEGRLGRELANAVARDAGAGVASGSIACVYRASLPDGRQVAIKVRRPGTERILRIDLAIMRRGAALLTKLPILRGVPVVEIVSQLTESVYRQVDLAAERENLDSLRRNLARFPGIRVPRPYPAASGEDILVMEFIEDLRRLRPEELTEEARRRAVVSALHGVYQMLFQDGLVHCDLHPGNLYLRRDGSVVIVDAGFTVRLSPLAQDKFASFFLHLTEGNGSRCADIVLSTAAPGPRTDTDGFRRELSELVDAHTGVKAAEFDLVRFATRLFDIQRRYGLYADPQFVFPILSLLVLEGTVREFAPDIDFQHEAVPFLVHGTMERAVRAWQATLPVAE